MLGLPLSVVPKLNQGKIKNSGLEVELSYDKQLNKHWHVYAKVLSIIIGMRLLT